MTAGVQRSVAFERVSSYPVEETCFICLEELSKTVNAVVLAHRIRMGQTGTCLGHYVHAGCLEECYQVAPTTWNCPVCKLPIQGRETCRPHPTSTPIPHGSDGQPISVSAP